MRGWRSVRALPHLQKCKYPCKVLNYEAELPDNIFLSEDQAEPDGGGFPLPDSRRRSVPLRRSALRRSGPRTTLVLLSSSFFRRSTPSRIAAFLLCSLRRS